MTLVAHPRRGRVRVRLEAIERRLVPPPPVEVVEGHPLPELTGASAEEIAAALVGAITAAHGDDPPWGADEERAAGHGLCQACLVTVALASRFANGDADPPVWPDPLVRVFEDEVMWRSEMARWTSDPGVTFDRAAWEIEQARMDAEHVYTDHYRGQTPPWVIRPGIPGEGADSAIEAAALPGR